jgi:predicted dehydrogenase
LRIAIVGSGYIARVHSRVAAALGGEVVAVCGRTLSSAAAFGAGDAYDSLARLLAEQKPDVLHVCTPNNLHAEQAIAAFAAGAHVLCEKPLATSSEDAMRMMEAADKAGRVGRVMRRSATVSDVANWGVCCVSAAAICRRMFMPPTNTSGISHPGSSVLHSR